MAYIRTKEHCEKISKSLKEKFKTGYIHPMKGKKQPKDGTEKMKQTIKNQFKNGRLVWNKGLTKEIDERVAKYGRANSKTRKKLLKEGKIKCFGHGINPSRAGELNFWFGKNRSGSLNPNWQGGISVLSYGLEWNERLREKIRNRYGRNCQLCNKPECKNEWGKLQVHHIDYNKLNCNEENLIPLCVGCNFKVNYKRTMWTQFFQKKVEVLL
jgi:hypothetical protein